MRAPAAARPPRAALFALAALLAVAAALLCGCRTLTGAVAPPAANAEYRTPNTEHPLFRDAAAPAGLAFSYYNGRKGIATILEESGSGCAMFDYDGDGWPDLYLLNGRDQYGRGVRSRNALYHNNGDGTFTDVTEKAGVPGTGYGLGVAVGDFDNDGHPDIYVCQYGKNCLYHNNGDGTFADATDRAGVGAMDYGSPFHTGCAWLDYDRDGRLDLFVCSYVRFRLDGLRYCKLPDGVTSNCPPSAYDSAPSLLFHNNGDGTFTNVTKKAGVYLPRGKALSALAVDIDDDGWTDLIVGNDGEPAWLLRNNRNGTFTNIGVQAGIAYAQDSSTMAAMGIDTGDFMNEGRPGFFVADFSKRPHHIWRRMPGTAATFFQETTAPSGIGEATFNYLGFGAGFLDYDNDGRLDLFETNGHVYPEIEHPGSDEHYLQPSQLLHNEGGGRFRETTKEEGPAFALRHAGRGAAFGDYDNDGAVDILVNDNDGTPMLLHNRPTPGRHFLSLRLVGTRSNRDAVGARIFLTAGGLRQRRDVKSGGSYLSSSDPRLHFGLGAAARADTVEVHWPSGLTQTFRDIPADGFYVLREGDPTPTPQAFRPARLARRSEVRR